MRLLMVVNEDRFFLSHRVAIAVAARQQGWDVTVACKDTGRRQDVEAPGLRMVDLPVNPTGMNPLQEARTLWFLVRLYRRERPDVVHHVGLKCMLWGGLAARWTGVRGVVNAVSGLGVMFADGKVPAKARAVLAVLRYACRRSGVTVIFQNHEDESLLLRHHVIKERQSAYVKGSGVDLKAFPYTPQPDDGKVRILFAARMTREKGVMTLIEAAERLRGELEGRAEFWLCGGLTKNPKAISKEEIEAACDGSYIRWLGHRDDVAALLAECHVVAFPSYYREGLPKTLIEACAAGRPVVTTDSIGCRDTVENGVNGFLVPVRDSRALADKLRVLIGDKVLRERMGREGRKKAEREFSLEDVVNRHLQIYRRLLSSQ